jgi:hypothetical protein
LSFPGRINRGGTATTELKLSRPLARGFFVALNLSPDPSPSHGEGSKDDEWQSENEY